MAEDTKKTKRPTALKRLIQSEKRRLINKAFRSRVRTAMNALELSLEKGDKAAAGVKMQEMYSIMDKGVKRGVYKTNKAARTKSRLTARVRKQTAAA